MAYTWPVDFSLHTLTCSKTDFNLANTQIRKRLKLMLLKIHHWLNIKEKHISGKFLFRGPQICLAEQDAVIEE